MEFGKFFDSVPFIISKEEKNSSAENKVEVTGMI